MIQEGKRQRNKNCNNYQILKDDDRSIESNEMPDQDLTPQKLLEMDLANRESIMSFEKFLDKDEDEDHSENDRSIRDECKKNKEKQEINIQADQVFSEQAMSKEIPDQKREGQNAVAIKTSTNENNVDQKVLKKQKGLIKRFCSAKKLFCSRSKRS